MFSLVGKKLLLAPLYVSTSGKKVFTCAIMCFRYWEECIYIYMFPLVGKKLLPSPLYVSTSGKKVFTCAIMCFH